MCHFSAPASSAAKSLAPPPGCSTIRRGFPVLVPSFALNDHRIATLCQPCGLAQETATQILGSSAHRWAQPLLDGKRDEERGTLGQR